MIKIIIIVVAKTYIVLTMCLKCHYFIFTTTFESSIIIINSIHKREL